MGVGDKLRAVYDQLSRDPASLANLDQDLPNYTRKYFLFLCVCSVFVWVRAGMWVWVGVGVWVCGCGVYVVALMRCFSSDASKAHAEILDSLVNQLTSLRSSLSPSLPPSPQNT